MNQPLISIIVPVYNVEKYLDRCVASILNQDYQNIEIILVEDGSKDNSLKIAQRLERNYESVKLYTQNAGVSAARNLGISKANGEFIMFVDSDDYIAENCCSVAINVQEKYNADIVFFDFIRINGENNILHSLNRSSGKISKEDSMCYLVNNSYVWGKIYKKEMFNNIKFPVGKYYEDLSTTYKVFEHAEKIIYIKEALYNYIETGQSIVGSKDSKQITDQFDADYQLFEFLKNNYPTVYAKCKNDLIIKSLRYCTFAGPKYDKELFDEAKNIILTSKINKRLSFRYKLTMGIFKFSPWLALQIFKIQKYRNRSHISQNEN